MPTILFFFTPAVFVVLLCSLDKSSFYRFVYRRIFHSAAADTSATKQWRIDRFRRPGDSTIDFRGLFYPLLIHNPKSRQRFWRRGNADFWPNPAAV